MMNSLWMDISGVKLVIVRVVGARVVRVRVGIDDSQDVDFFMDLENQVDDVDVDMIEFHIYLDEYVAQIPTTFKVASYSGISCPRGEDLEVIDPYSFESPVVDEDDYRLRMLRDLSKVKVCFQGEVHEHTFKLGQKFKTKKHMNVYINKYIVETKRDIHFEKE